MHLLGFSCSHCSDFPLSPPALIFIPSSSPQRFADFNHDRGFIMCDLQSAALIVFSSIAQISLLSFSPLAFIFIPPVFPKRFADSPGSINLYYTSLNPKQTWHLSKKFCGPITVKVKKLFRPYLMIWKAILQSEQVLLIKSDDKKPNLINLTIKQKCFSTRLCKH